MIESFFVYVINLMYLGNLPTNICVVKSEGQN